MGYGVAAVLADAGQLGHIQELAGLTGRDFLAALRERIPVRLLKDRNSEVRFRDALSEGYKATLWDCEQRLQDLLKEPNRALFGIVEEFRDRVLRARSMEDEWRAIYQDARAEVWTDQFAALADHAVHMRTWSESVERLRDLLDRAAGPALGRAAAR